MTGPLFFFKGSDSSFIPTADELSHWHFPSSPGQGRILNFFTEPSGTSLYAVSADVSGGAVGELESSWEVRSWPQYTLGLCLYFWSDCIVQKNVHGL